MKSDILPWGRYDTLVESDDYKIKEILVESGKRLSYQSHKHRDELWYIIEGFAKVTLDGEIIHISEGQTIKILALQKHRVHNTSSKPLRFLEVQTGSYFGEDDIKRFEDDFGRV